MSDVTAALQGLRDGTVTTDDAVTQFSQRQWPVRLAHQPAVTPGDDLAADVADGSFGEVQAAYAAGWIDDEQFARLAQAAASSITGAPPAGSDTDAGTDRDGDGDTDNDAWMGDGHPAARQDDLFDVTRTKGLAPMPRAAASPGGGGDGNAESKVYARGVQAWPGSQQTALSPHEWATARVGAFQSKQAGIDVPGYVRDDDLLNR